MPSKSLDLGPVSSGTEPFTLAIAPTLPQCHDRNARKDQAKGRQTIEKGDPVPIEPDEQQFAEVARLADAQADHPVVMLNLNRYRERAAYEGEVPGGLVADVSGHEAYVRYGAVAVAVLARLGGRVLWQADASLTVVGDETDRYDEVIAVWYPSLGAFLALATDQEILAARAHRAAGLERAALIACESGPEPVLAAPEP
jgi:uncharacterized protein (DUF1330 family)